MRKGYTLIELIIVIVILCVLTFGVFGWISNVAKFVQNDFEEPYKEEIIRGIGIPVIPMGMIVGYINF